LEAAREVVWPKIKTKGLDVKASNPLIPLGNPPALPGDTLLNETWRINYRYPPSQGIATSLTDPAGNRSLFTKKMCLQKMNRDAESYQLKNIIS